MRNSQTVILRFFTALLIVSTLFSLTACGHRHNWQAATCDAPQICADCRATEGEKLTHLVSDDGTCKLCKKVVSVLILDGEKRSVPIVLYDGVKLGMQMRYISGDDHIGYPLSYVIYDQAGTLIKEGSWPETEFSFPPTDETNAPNFRFIASVDFISLDAGSYTIKYLYYDGVYSTTDHTTNHVIFHPYGSEVEAAVPILIKVGGTGTEQNQGSRENALIWVLPMLFVLILLLLAVVFLWRKSQRKAPRTGSKEASAKRNPMSGTTLYLRMTLRRKASMILVILFTATVTVFLLLYPRLIDSTRQELENAYDYKAVQVTAKILNPSGFGEPDIKVDVLDRLVKSGLLGDHQAVCKVNVNTAAKAWMDARYDDYAPTDLERAKAYADDRSKLAKENKNISGWKNPHDTALTGITSLQVSDTLKQQASGTKWLDGYSEESLRGSEPVAVVSQDTDYALGDIMIVAFQVGEQKFEPLQLKVVGILAVNVKETVYCPLRGLQVICEEMEREYYFRLSYLTVTLVDTRKMEAFRDLLQSVAKDPSIKISVDDRAYEGTIGPIRGNLQMLEGLYPVFFAAVAAIGFVLCFLLVRRRKQEFAVMRLLGETGMQITEKALLEQAMLCAIGVVLGTVIVLVSGLGEFSALTCGGVLLCYSIGSALAVMLMVRVNVMEILRDKE